MERIIHDLPGGVGGLSVFRFGPPAAVSGRKAYLQAGLHMDEFPGMLVLRILTRLLTEAEVRGRIQAEIVLVPQANTIGLAQTGTGFLFGRLETASGQNFNRGYADLGPLDALRHRLLVLAHDADLVLDLHADNQAEPHLYIGPALWPEARDIAAAIEARAVLLAEISGGNPFDEACSGPWWLLAARHPEAAIPPACLATTLEMGSNDDVDPARAEVQAAALLRVLEGRGFVDGPGGRARLSCEATPLAAMSQIRSPVSGLVAYQCQLGDSVRAGDPVARVLDPLGGETELRAETSGRLFARHSQPYAWPGRVLGKIAGAEVLATRRGNLLTD